jgi:hypothetical protein
MSNFLLHHYSEKKNKIAQILNSNPQLGNVNFAIFLEAILYVKIQTTPLIALCTFL